MICDFLFFFCTNGLTCTFSHFVDKVIGMSIEICKNLVCHLKFDGNISFHDSTRENYPRTIITLHIKKINVKYVVSLFTDRV